MKNFQHINASDTATALKELQESGSQAIAGGTDLIPELKKYIRAPKKLVNIKRIPQLHEISDINGNLKIGALTTITDLETDWMIRRRFGLEPSSRCGRHASASKCRDHRWQYLPECPLLVLPASRCPLLVKRR